MNGPSVLLTTDGTYPCYRGGVSVWCDQIIRQLPDVRFHLFAVTYSPSALPLFPQPENMASLQMLPLWGTPEPGPVHGGFLDSWLLRLQTTPEQIRGKFLPHFETVLRCILVEDVPHRPRELAFALTALHKYFADFDYAVSISSPECWEAFLRICREQSDEPTLQEAGKCLRWLQRYLAIAASSFPQTEIVHSSMAGLAGIPGVLQRTLHGSSFILSEHGIFLRELYLSLGRMQESRWCRRFLFRWFEAVVGMNYAYADKVTSLCEFNRKWQIRMGALPERIEIVPNGVDAAVFHPPEATARRAAPVVLTMARIYRLKGIDHLLRAARLVLDKAPEVRWRILGEVGDREYHEDCMRIAAELGISDSLEWSLTSNPSSAYREADVFCLPSISEAMPYSVLEAMFSYCPVVATDVGGVAEMLENTGLVVPPRNPAKMAEALLSLLSGDGAAAYREELAGRALHRARSRYDITVCSRHFRRIYEPSAESIAPAGLLAAR
jgi:glycosyltransferase involved in cell wall biosynthesis